MAGPVEQSPFAQTPTAISKGTKLLQYPADLGTNQQYQACVAFYVNSKPESVPLTNTSTRSSTSISTAIWLPIMTAPNVRYGADWDSTTLGPILGWALQTPGEHDVADAIFDIPGMLTGVPGAGGRTLERAKGLAPILGNVVKTVGLSLLNQGAGIAGLGGSAGNTDIYQILSKTAVNEHRAQIFKSMRFRQFQFEYHMVPRNAQEAQTIQSIIYQFKLNMHPDDTNSSQFTLSLPNTFNIGFYFNNVENPNLFNISECVLTDFTVQYGGGEHFYMYKDGMPTEIIMTLAFTELEIITRKRLTSKKF